MRIHAMVSPPPALAAYARRLALAVLVAALTGAAASCPAGAEARSAHHGWDGGGHGNRRHIIHKGSVRAHNGNGKYNRTYSTAHSPTDLSGVQQVSNTTVSGNTPTQTAYCRRKHFCKIRQKVWVSRHRH
ncbi:hypothetical protein [Sphaerisporangium fuscum]|uniref:hypothetical protein n=1 Tax=Sphaerisporangium fuscum TaxID=2835868 RepID=UPI001BDCA6AC|nr:hypothetical protein [Sphaerisporangium fuscum]